MATVMIDEELLIPHEDDNQGLEDQYLDIDFNDPDVLINHPELEEMVPEHNPDDPDANFEERFIRRRGDATDETCGPFVAERDEDAGCCRGKCTGEMFGGCGKLDYVQFPLYLTLFLAHIINALLLALGKIKAHNQCLPHINIDANRIVTDNPIAQSGCYINMYYSMVGVVLSYLFIMTKYIAQLNNNSKWMRVEMVLVWVGLLGMITALASMVLAVVIWCSDISNTRDCYRKNVCPDGWRTIQGSCYNAVVLIDKYYEKQLVQVYGYTVSSLTMSSFCTVMWLAAVIVMMTKYCSPDKQKKDEEREKIRKEIEAKYKAKEAQQEEERQLKALIERGPSHKKDRRRPQPAPNGIEEVGDIEEDGIAEIPQPEPEDDGHDLIGWQNIADHPGAYQDPPGLRDDPPGLRDDPPGLRDDPPGLRDEAEETGVREDKGNVNGEQDNMRRRVKINA